MCYFCAPGNSMSKRSPKHRLFKLRFVRLMLWLLGIGLTIPAFQLAAYRFVNPPFTWLMLERRYLPEQGKEIKRIKHAPVDLPQISRQVVFAVIAAEDQNFLGHTGLDLQAIEKAIQHNQRHKRKRGASTISQQTAKNAFLWESRSWVRKGLELPLTLGIEALWGKRRILEVYLNVAEFGPGVFGIEAAARHWFQVSAKNLTPRQAALLAASLPSPRKYNPRNPGKYLSGKADWIEQQIRFMDQQAILKELELR